MQRFLLASLHEQYFLEMLSGKKKYEHRDSIYTHKLPLPFFIVWYITTPTARIQGISSCNNNTGKGIPLIETVRLENSITLSELREKFTNSNGSKFNPPQSYMYLTEGMKELIEQRNPALQEFYARHPQTFTPRDPIRDIKEAKKQPDIQYKLEF